MAHERLSPRQKMIGMMYLILTAMLALNVSKEAVKAFMKVEEGLTKTVKNYETKNKEIYDMFEKKYAENPVRGGPARAKAFYVKQRADELFNYLQDLKIKIIKKTDKEKAEKPNKNAGGRIAIQGREIDIYAVDGYDNTNTPSEILIGAKENGEAFALRAAINDFRDSLILIVGGKNTAVEDALRSSLSTADGRMEGKKGLPEAWPNNQFQTLPLVAVVAMLTKLQVDVRNAETDVITFLYDEIDKRSFKFNRLVPTVQTNSTYVMVGGEYSASVFFAAVDTTQKPIVTVGQYTTNGINADGTPKYEMVGTNYQTLDYDESGKGVYKVRPGAGTTPGQKDWGGLITMKAPDGTVIAKPFKATYEVGNQNVVISLTAMNVLYRGIPNPIDISVPGVGPDKVRAVMNNGKIVKGTVQNYKGETFPGSWVAEPDITPPSPTAQIIVSAEVNGKQTQFKPMEYRIRDIPNPIGEFAGKSGQGIVSKSELVAQQGVRAVLLDFDFNLQFRVTSFNLTYQDKGLDLTEPSPSNMLTAKQKALLNGLTRGKKLYIESIHAVGPDKKDRVLGPIQIIVN
jgi:gliding motility-associated protein GldM